MRTSMWEVEFNSTEKRHIVKPLSRYNVFDTEEAARRDCENRNELHYWSLAELHKPQLYEISEKFQSIFTRFIVKEGSNCITEKLHNLYEDLQKYIVNKVKEDIEESLKGSE